MALLRILKHQTPHLAEAKVWRNELTILEGEAFHELAIEKAECKAIANIFRNTNDWKMFAHGLRAFLSLHDQSVLTEASVWHLPEQHVVASERLPTAINAISTWLNECFDIETPWYSCAEWAIAAFVHPINYRIACKMADVEMWCVLAKRKKLVAPNLKPIEPKRIQLSLPKFVHIPVLGSTEAQQKEIPFDLFEPFVNHLKTVGVKRSQYTQQYTSIASPQEIEMLLRPELSAACVAEHFLLMQKIPLLAQQYFDALTGEENTLEGCFTKTVGFYLMKSLGRTEHYVSEIIESWKKPHGAIESDLPSDYIESTTIKTTWNHRGMIPSFANFIMADGQVELRSSRSAGPGYSLLMTPRDKIASNYQECIGQCPNILLSTLVARKDHIIKHLRLTPINF